MKIHLIIVSIILQVANAENECTDCDWEKDVHCGKASDGSCVFSALNRCQVERISCRREQKGLPSFTEIVKGKCPKGKPRCPRP
ncbi:accessory gland protein Acp63F [Drosophila eugracilis]|uniref:accessory gland protein Acp63F n=1 Tax=Drosophila eugracilis TaxID=29029 RepID=UPI0007E7E4EC|nr:accessory gland protein Acp63F [Drosophila eugracilis]